ncbi:uncharacterized protein LOC106873184 [Octopus bimaculoides]|uniref:uncharacterized protein LOC106873184 n=1 Tax=Octopus bimaculoides TaxID=37653 RepID=UPI00071C2CC1|nr:uncharacterized protein LOC106873184 [Octopus bimaculoides]|eukprot:XP_014775908.1 PREDICTED: uncharacterized protein LOC106873184 [Octopus bimaculoides]
MGILSRSNGYVDESVQKAGIPGCIEHCFLIWKTIQDAKQNKRSLNMVWLDLANAYGSVPHELLMRAMDHFHIPDKVTKIMRLYYDSFEMRFTAGDFTTDWHQLEIGIAAGCTICHMVYLNHGDDFESHGFFGINHSCTIA